MQTEFYTPFGLMTLDQLLMLYFGLGFAAALIILLVIFRGAPLTLAKARLLKKPLLLLADSLGWVRFVPIKKMASNYVETRAGKFVVAKVKRAEKHPEAARYYLRGLGVPILIAHNERGVATDPGTLKIIITDPEAMKDVISELNSPTVLELVKAYGELAATKRQLKAARGVDAKTILLIFAVMIIAAFAIAMFSGTLPMPGG